ncbi:MAG TPA: hypothetical protein VFJ27_05925 [Terriglobia bacterium]|nr:hypothetical protein [Terriglobia bacterium]
MRYQGVKISGHGSFTNQDLPVHTDGAQYLYSPRTTNETTALAKASGAGYKREFERMAMPADLSRWPRKALAFTEALSAAVESFVSFPIDREFDSSRPAKKQLFERVDELSHPSREEAMQFVLRELTEAECRQICTSRHQ